MATDRVTDVRAPETYAGDVVLAHDEADAHAPHVMHRHLLGRSNTQIRCLFLKSLASAGLPPLPVGHRRLRRGGNFGSYGSARALRRCNGTGKQSLPEQHQPRSDHMYLTVPFVLRYRTMIVLEVFATNHVTAEKSGSGVLT